jgi:hypothetical protein
MRHSILYAWYMSFGNWQSLDSTPLEQGFGNDTYPNQDQGHKIVYKTRPDSDPRSPPFTLTMSSTSRMSELSQNFMRRLREQQHHPTSSLVYTDDDSTSIPGSSLDSRRINIEVLLQSIEDYVSDFIKR